MSPRDKWARTTLIAGVFALLLLEGCTPFHFYQTYISPIDGDRCPMVPSCSAYAKAALKKHGPLVGGIMAMDRLVRCGRDEGDISPRVMVTGIPHIFDPVENNDFWWAKP